MVKCPSVLHTTINLFVNLLDWIEQLRQSWRANEFFFALIEPVVHINIGLAADGRPIKINISYFSSMNII